MTLNPDYSAYSYTPCHNSQALPLSNVFLWSTFEFAFVFWGFVNLFYEFKKKLWASVWTLLCRRLNVKKLFSRSEHFLPSNLKKRKENSSQLAFIFCASYSLFFRNVYLLLMLPLDLICDSLYYIHNRIYIVNIEYIK